MTDGMKCPRCGGTDHLGCADIVLETPVRNVPLEQLREGEAVAARELQNLIEIESNHDETADEILAKMNAAESYLRAAERLEAYVRFVERETAARARA